MTETLGRLTVFIFQGIKKGFWLPGLVFVMHVIAAKIFDAYVLFPALDIPMHFIGGVAICYFFWQSTKVEHADQFLGIHTKFSLFILLIASTATATVLWEFLEWISDTYFGGDAQVSITDTMGDMFLGLLGGACVAFYAAKRQ